MDPAVVVPIVSVVTSAVVAVGVPWANGRRDDRRAERQMNNGRVDELRGVLDEAGLALIASALACAEAEIALERSELITTNDGGVVRVGAQDAMKKSDDAHLVVQRCGNRIAIRLSPDHSLAALYEHARKELYAAHKILGAVFRGETFGETEKATFRSHVEVALDAGDNFQRGSASVIGPTVEVRQLPVG